MKELLNSTQNKIILGLIALIIVMIIIYFVFFSKSEEDTALNDDLKTSQLSYDQSQYYAFADAVEVATSGFADDEEAIYNVFEQLYNINDYYMLKKAFGNRTYFGGTMFFSENLTFVLHAVLNDSELEKINGILADNNINIII